MKDKKMKPNFWIYADKNEQKDIADSLIVFGAENFKRAKIITDIKPLKNLLNDLESGKIKPQDSNITEYAQEYLVDCLRIMIFFENYMKAELILKNFCVHRINKNIDEFKELADIQNSRPIKLKEISEIEQFYVNKENKIINHRAINETTIGIKELIGSTHYLSNYQIDSSLLDFVKEINRYRNHLHFNHSAEFILSKGLISNIDFVNNFVDEKIKEIIRTRN